MYSLFLVLAAIVSLVYYFLIANYGYWRKKGVVHLKPELIFGNLGKLARMERNLGETYQELYEKYDGHPYIGIYELRRPALLIRDPKLIKQIMIKDFNYFHSRGMTYNPKVDPLSAHILHLIGDKWRAKRSKLTQVFTSSKIRDVSVQIEKTADQFTEFVRQYADNEETVEMRELAAKFTSEVISTCCFGFESNSIQHGLSEFRVICKKVLDPSTVLTVKRFVRNYLPWVYETLQMVITPKEVTTYFTRIVKEIVSYREENNIFRPDFMQTMLEIKKESMARSGRKLQNRPLQTNQEQENENPAVNGDATDTVFDDAAITAHSFLFLFAGFETSSTAMSFVMYELAVNPEIQDRLYNEIRDVLEKYGRASYEAISEMHYLDRVVNETLRKHPPAGAVGRMCNEDYTIPGTNLVIEKGTMVTMPIHAIHHDPKYFENPDKFDPDRFLEENKRKRAAGTFIPFGDGPRNCIGLRFATAQTKAGLVALLKDYQFSLGPQTPVPLVYETKSLILSVKSGIWVKIRHRQK